MIDALWLKALTKALILPPTGLLLLAAIGLALAGRYPRAGRALASGCVAVLLLLSVPAVGDWLSLRVDDSVPLDVARARDAQAIVILGGGVRQNAPEYGGETLAVLTLERVRYGARLAKLTQLPVLVSGGAVSGATAEAPLMKAALEDEFGVSVRWIEPVSTNTHENALYSARILRSAGVSRVLLVAHGIDMRRARAEFADQGIEALAAPTSKRTNEHDSLFDFLPAMSGLIVSYYAVYEIVANAVLALKSALR